MLNRYIFDMLNIFSFHSLSTVYKNLSLVGTTCPDPSGKQSLNQWIASPESSGSQ